MAKKKKQNNVSPTDMDELWAQVSAQKQARRQRYEDTHSEALRHIREVIGYKEIADYTISDVIEFVEKKYNGRIITVSECLDYIFHFGVSVESLKRENNPIHTLTEGYITDDSCTVMLLPPKSELIGEVFSKLPKKNGAIVFLDNTDNRLGFHQFEGNYKGYEDLDNELDVFRGKMRYRF